MAGGNEYRGKTKLGIIAALSVIFSIWLAVASKIVLTALIMITLAVLLFIGFRAVRYIFIVIQLSRGYYAFMFLADIFSGTEGHSFDEMLYYILYLIFAVTSIIMLLADKDIREFYRK